ncbi:MAG: hypothetical protein K1X89_07795 [Myxococcaceae bacterium]|nr:hypothetical protein [Myxococcaceae bacterium]
MRLTLLLSLAGLIAGCGGTHTQVTGSVGGKSLNALDAVALSGVTGTGPGKTGAVIVMIGEQASACTNWTGGKFKSNAALLMLTVGVRGETATVPPPGTYPVTTSSSTTGPVGAAVWYVTDDKCKAGSPVPATSGTIKLDSSTDGARGSFDLKMLDGSALTGSFGATSCLFLTRVLNPDSDSTCMP